MMASDLPTDHQARRRRARQQLIQLLALAALGAVAFLLAVPTAFRGVTGAGTCETTTYQEARSPGGDLIARVQMTDCGATTGFSRIVWVQPARFDGSGHGRCRALALENEPPVDLRWATDGSLVVSTPVSRSEFIAAESECHSTPIRIEQAS